ncbi:type II toxin-antitoxin system RnlB family antitoxin [Paenibacillus sp. MCAF9]|uniref:type II toxin-antitoxin system RnlB family antitoxin n=1 Tax=Paenibacillus sp. MCAF9 TaxID=3233046 RepID=UPI003F94CB4A
MLKNYEIQKSGNNEGYPFIIFSTSYMSPIDDIICIEHDLQSQYKGKVLFDLLLSNGVSSNRFVEAEFNGEHFDYSSFKTLRSVCIAIKKESTEFYKNHTDFLENSTLPNAYQYLIKKGKVL